MCFDPPRCTIGKIGEKRSFLGFGREFGDQRDERKRLQISGAVEFGNSNAVNLSKESIEQDLIDENIWTMGFAANQNCGEFSTLFAKCVDSKSNIRLASHAIDRHAHTTSSDVVNLFDRGFMICVANHVLGTVAFDEFERMRGGRCDDPVACNASKLNDKHAD